jgi:hypothetical protein
MHNKNYIGLLTVMFLMLIFSDVSKGAEFTVSDMQSFQAALTEAASNGQDDVITVGAGTYALSSTLTYIIFPADSAEGNSLTIEGAGPDETILDGYNSVQILRIDSQEATDDSVAHFIVRNMTLQNGNHAGQAAGLSIWTNAADMTVENCIFKNNVSTGSSFGDGGGARLRSQSGGEITVKNCEFDGNSAYYGGGVWAISYFGTSEKRLQFLNNRFTNNSAWHSYGGLYVYEYKGTVKISGNLFTGNSANNSGGVADTDTDSDGAPDCNDECPSDPVKTEPGVCGCGNPDTDNEPDGMVDCWELLYGLNTSIDDADDDLDGDGFKNIDEYEEGTDPKDPKSHPPRSMPWLPILLDEEV